MIGGVVAEALPELRAQAESLMTATAVITRDEEPHWDEATETMAGGAVTVYDGPARLIRASAGKVVDAAGDDAQATPYIVAVPHDVQGIADGDRLTIGGLDLRVGSTMTGTHAVELRVACTEFA